VNGEVDAIVNPDLKTLELLARNPDLKIDEVTSGAAITMPMHVDVAPFDSNDIRMALKLAIDREQILKTIFKGHGTIGNDHPIAPVLPFWSEMEQRTYDPEKAKHHLKKAGAEGLKVQLSAADAAFSGAVDMAVLYAEQAKAAGIEVEVIREADDGYWSNVWLKKPFCMCYWSGRSTPDSIYSLAYAAGSDWNDTHYKNERFNELMVQARAELDTAKRTEMYAEMQTIYNGDGGTIIPMFRNFLFARRSNVNHGEAMTGHWTLDGGRAAERWWFS
jgi:peptide/nickel transport system substrate-binding protein